MRKYSVQGGAAGGQCCEEEGEISSFETETGWGGEYQTSFSSLKVKRNISVKVAEESVGNHHALLLGIAPKHLTVTH